METRGPVRRAAFSCLAFALMAGLGGCAGSSSTGAGSASPTSSSAAGEPGSPGATGTAKIDPAVAQALANGESIRVLISANEGFAPGTETAKGSGIADDSEASAAKRAIVAAGGDGLELRHDYPSLPLILATLSTTDALDAVAASGAATSIDADGVVHTMGTRG